MCLWIQLTRPQSFNWVLLYFQFNLDLDTPGGGEGLPNWKTGSLWLACGHVCGSFSWLMIYVKAQPPPLGRWLCQKGWASYEEQNSSQYYSMASASFPTSRFMPWISFSDELWYGSISQISPFLLPSYLWSKCYHSNTKETRTLLKALEHRSKITRLSV